MFNPQQQREISNEISKELEKVELSWNTEMREWYEIAILALRYASPASLQIPAKKYKRLFEKSTHGLNANVVAILCNNLECRTANELDLALDKYVEILELNQKIADNWEALCDPIRKSVMKKYELMAPVKKIQTVGEA